MIALVAVVALSLSGCGSSLINGSSTTSTPGTAAPSTTVLSGEVAVAFPVVACTTSTGVAASPIGWHPSVLVAPIPTALVGKVEFYSDGVHTLLGPTGWACAQTQSAGDASGLVVYPPTTSAAPVTLPVSPGTQGVFGTFDATGEVSGILMVCTFFLMPAFQTARAKCPPSKPAGEQVSMPTPDIASVTDPAGAIGSLQSSGGATEVTGTVIFPQEFPQVGQGGSIAVASESCSLPTPSLCPTVLSDFDVREFPVPGTSSHLAYVPTPGPTPAPVQTPATTAVTPTTTTAPTPTTAPSTTLAPTTSSTGAISP